MRDDGGEDVESDAVAAGDGEAIREQCK